MKHLITLSAIVVFAMVTPQVTAQSGGFNVKNVKASENVTVGSESDKQIQITNRAISLPPLTKEEINALTPQEGMLVYDTDSDVVMFYSAKESMWLSVISPETDPVYVASVASGITATDITSWNNKLDSETDPTVPAHVKAITSDNVSDWNQAHGWGDHLAEGYATKNMNSEKITNLADPTDAQDAATKAYVDALLARIEALEEKDLLNNGFTDPRDNNHYNVVKIGNQIWMAENLAYLPSVNMVADGSEDAAGSYYYVYGYDGTNVADAKATDNYATYGVLYNWTAAMDGAASSTTNPSGVQGVCPDGWHLPSDAEWTELTYYLGGTSDAGGKLKETGTTHWNSPNTGATNETGFTALPGGYRGTNGTFNHVGNDGYWWSATENTANNALTRSMYYYDSNVNRGSSIKAMVFSVRCLRD